MKKVSIKDVAKLAKCSIASVSRYLNNPELLTPETQKRVSDAIKTLNYHPSAIAQGMRKQSSKYIAMIIENITNPVFAEILKGAEQCVSENDYDIVFLSTKKGLKEKTIRNILFSRDFIGIVVCVYIDEENREIINTLKERGIPVVVIGNKIFKDNFASILSDDYKAFYDGTKYLIDKGHKDIALVCVNMYHEIVDLRKKGYMDALADNSIKYDPGAVYIPDHSIEDSIEGGMQVAKKIIEDGINKYTAIFCLSDYIAVGILKYLINNNIKVPEDISILGYDNIELAKIVTPGLTTIHQKKKKMGYLATKKIIEFFEKKQPKKTLIELSTKIVERESVKDIRSIAK